MKRRLNILTLLILLGFGLHIGFNTYFSIEPFMSGFNEGYNAGRALKDEQKKSSVTHREIELIKSGTVEMLPDSVYNKKSGTWEPMQIAKMTVSVENDKNISKEIWFFIPLGLGLVVASIAFILFFLKLIIAVNRSKVFDRHNIFRLRALGTIFICMGTCVCLGNYIDYYISSSLVDIPGYELSAKEVFDFSYFIYALISFLAAEIFAIGLHLKEEQELTI